MFESRHPPETPRWIRVLYHLPNYGRLVRRLWNDPRVPIYRKGIPVLFGTVCLFVGLIYFASKFDLVPDFFPFIGKLDDLALLLLLLFAPGGWLFIRLSPPEIVAEHVAAIDVENRRRGRI
jgi:hypothetical protein